MSKEDNQKFLITGATGMLGIHVLEVARAYQVDAIWPIKGELNICDVNRFFKYRNEGNSASILHRPIQICGIQRNMENSCTYVCGVKGGDSNF